MKTHERQVVVANVVHDIARALNSILRLHCVDPTAVAVAGRALDQILRAHLAPSVPRTPSRERA